MIHESVEDKRTLRGESGFTLAEVLVSTFILLIISGAVFRILADVQQTASYQTEIQAVLDNSRVAMEIVENHLRQAGNDPLQTSLVGLTIVSPTEVQVRSDLTGSAGPTYPDKGDPDGDIADSNENITIRYNAGTRNLEVVPSGGPAQIVASYISAFSMQYFDANGNTTAVGADVRKIRVSISGASTLPNPKNNQIFGVQLNSDIQISSRQ